MYDEIYDLSPMQEGMLLNMIKNDISEAYTNQLVIELVGEIDSTALKSACQMIMTKYKILNNAIVYENLKQPYQVYRGVRNVDFEFVEVYSIDNKSDYVSNERKRGFDLKKENLIRFRLVMIRNQNSYFVITNSHVIMDGWSIGILIGELFRFYGDIIMGKDDNACIDPIDYKGYIEWLKLQDTDRASIYWKDYLQNYERLAELPDIKGKLNNRGIYRETCVYLDEETVGLLNMKAKQFCVTTCSIIQTIWGSVLQKYNDSDDVVFGNVTSGRYSDINRVNEMVGLMINTVPLRVKTNEKECFWEVCKKVFNNSGINMMYSYFPLPEINKCTQLLRLFNNIFVYQNYPLNYACLQSQSIQVKQITITENSEYDFCLSVVPGNRYKIMLTYDSGIHCNEEIELIATHIEEAIHRVLDSDSILMEDVCQMTAMETEIVDCNIHSYINKDYNLRDILLNSFHLHEHRTAIITQEGVLTYEELYDSAKKVKNYLLSMDYEISNALVGIYGYNRIETIITIMGIIMAGYGYVPISSSYPANKVKDIIRDSDVTTIVCTCDEVAKIKDGDVKLLSYTDISVQQVEADHEAKRGMNSIAYVIFTSGTTGKSKGVVVEDHNVVSLLDSCFQVYDVSENDTWSMLHSFCFDFSVWEMFGALITGGTLIVPDEKTRADANRVIALLNQYKVTVLSQTPKVFYTLIQCELEQKEHNLDIRYVIFGGDVLRPNLLQPWLEVYPDCQMINMYGITETTVHCTYKYVAGDMLSNKWSNIGKTLDNTNIYILDHNNRRMPLGCIGEICVSGYGVSREYINNSEYTAQKFIDHVLGCDGRVYKSGDKGRILLNGDIEYIGRNDCQIKIRGFRVDIIEVENTLKRFDDVQDAIVMSYCDKTFDEISLRAYFVANKLVDLKELRNYMLQYLSYYCIPTVIMQLDSMPTNSNGKIDIDKIPAYLIENQGTPKNDIIFVDDLTQRVMEIWENVLGVCNISTDDNFFALGGDSLKVIRIVNRCNKEFAVHVELDDVFKHQDSMSFSDVIRRQKLESKTNLYHETGMSVIQQMKDDILPKYDIENEFDLEDIYPITEIEKGMIFASKINDEVPVYYDQVSQVTTITDFNIFKSALDYMVMRHSNLRSLYFMNEYGLPLKIVLKSMVAPLVVTDISKHSKEQQLKCVEEYLHDNLQERYTFEGEILWKLQVFYRGNDSYHLVLNFHHSVLDGWSKSVFLTEMSQIVNMIVNGSANHVSKTFHSYKDYCAIEIGRKLDLSSQQYWCEQLYGYERCCMPINIMNRKRQNNQFNLKNRKFNEEESKEIIETIRKLARKYNVAQKSIYVSAFAWLLKICCFNDDVVFGLVAHSRPAFEDGDSILGCFLNTMPIRFNFSRMKKACIDTIKEAHNTILAMSMNEMHLSAIMNAINESTSEKNPIFDILFNYTNFFVRKEWNSSQNILSFGQTITEGELAGTEMTNTFFDFEVDTTLDNLYIQVKYNRGLLNDSEIDFMMVLYVKILNQICSHTNEDFSPEWLLDDAEKELFFDRFNNTRVQRDDKNVVVLFEDAVCAYGEKAAIITENVVMTYDDLYKRVNQTARCFRKYGIRPGMIIGISREKSTQIIIEMLAILKLGATYIPIDNDYPNERKKDILAQAGAAYAIGCFGDDIDAARILDYDETKYDSNQIDFNIAPDSLAYIIFTSGTTGKPKGVMIRHNALYNLILSINDKFQVGTKDRILQITSVSFDLSVYEILGLLSCGGAVVCNKSNIGNDIEESIDVLKKARITIWNSVPSTLAMLVDYLRFTQSDVTFPDIRLIMLSGDWIPLDLYNKTKVYFPLAQFYSLGGATEATIWSNYYKVDKIEDTWLSIPYGLPLDNNYFYVLDDERNILPIGTVGNLYIGGMGVAAGYINDRVNTETSFFDDTVMPERSKTMYRTGDLGRINENGIMEILGRRDYQVKINGYRIEILEIEKCLKQYSDVDSAVVVYNCDKRLVAYITVSNPVNIEELLQFTQTKLPSYMVPNIIKVLDVIPVTNNKKIDRAKLSKIRVDNDKAIEIPKVLSDTEQQLVQIWQEVLGNNAFDVRSNFFMVGGNSIKATSLVAIISRNLKIKIPITIVFQKMNIVELADYIDTILTDSL